MHSFISTSDLQAVVGRSVVNDNDLDVFIGLIEATLDSLR